MLRLQLSISKVLTFPLHIPHNTNLASEPTPPYSEIGLTDFALILTFPPTPCSELCKADNQIKRANDSEIGPADFAREWNTMTEKVFNSIEALKIAINLERDGYDFYRRIVEMTESTSVKGIFKRLADDEIEHRKLFQSMHDALVNSDEGAEYYDDESIGEYLRRLVDTGVFRDYDGIDALVSSVGKDRDAVKIGIRMEKEAILLFSELMRNTGSTEGKKTFAGLVEVEKEHLEILTDLLRAMAKKK